MEDKNQTSLDDLISSSGGQPIIVQKDSDKKFLYTLLILLVILFIIAIAIIAFLGSKYFGNNNNVPKTNKVTQVVSKPSVANSTNKTVQKAIEVAKTKVTQKKKSEEKVDNTLNELENLVKQEETKKPKKQKVVKKEIPAKEVKKPATKEQKVIQQVATATGGKNLSQEDLAKIAKLVAQELAKSKSNTTTNKTTKNTTSSNSSDDQALVSSLESAQTDTLKNENVDTSGLKDTKVNASGKKVDTFNKVIIKKQDNSDDELAKLSSEIDTILQSEEVTQKEKNLKYGKELKQEISRREQELRFIVVKKGDTLSSLAYKAYGRASAYVKIYKANPDLVKNPNRIYVGMKLRVPVDEEYLKQQGN